MSPFVRVAAVKKLAYAAAAGSLIYAYAQECKNDVIYFNKASK